MAAYTTSGSGNWNDNATWGGGGYPTTGDTATIATGHTVTIPVSTTSTSGAVTFNNGTGKLVVIGTWNLGGDVTMGGGTNIIQADPGSIIDLNGYSIIQNTTGVAYNFIGTSGSRVTVRSTGTAGQVTISGVTTVTPTFRFVDFSGIGDAVWGRSNNGTSIIEMTDCTVTGCGAFYLDISGGGVGSSYIIQRNQFINPSSTTPQASSKWQPYVFCTAVSNGTGRRIFSDNIWTTTGTESNVCYLRVATMLITRNVFHNVTVNSLRGDVYFVNNFFYNPKESNGYGEYFRSIGGSHYHGNFWGNYCYYDDGDHATGQSGANSDDPIVSRFNIFDGLNATTGTNWWMNPTLFNAKNDLFLGQGNYAVTVSAFAATWDISRVTFYGSNDGELSGGQALAPFIITEQLSTLTGTVNFRSNFSFNPDTTNKDWDVFIALLNATDNQIDVCTHNYAWGDPGGSHTPTYDTNLDVPAPGTSDGSANPQFVNGGREIKAWCSTRGYGAATVAAAITAMQADTERIADLMAWVWEGYMPTNSALRTVAHDGGLVGAANYRNTAQDTSTIINLITSAESDYGVTVSSPF
jgi:hypothetical protein